MAGYFAVFLVLITLASGLIWLIDAKLYAPARREKIASAQATTNGVLADEELEKIAPQPAIAETAQSIFPILAAITIFRSFLFEPFQIPSGSMMPTMLVGDFILVQKYSYGVHDPIWRSELIETGAPERGDIAVFKFPLDERVDYIKRVVGLPGDRIVYKNKQLFIKPNCEREPENCNTLNKIELKGVEQGQFEQQGVPLITANEQLGDVNHQILVNPSQPSHYPHYYRQSFAQAGEWTVPENQFFLMGDNRDNSQDGRYWGFVKEDQLVGKAVFIWMSFVYNEGQVSWLPNWFPIDVRFSRLGSVE